MSGLTISRRFISAALSGSALDLMRFGPVDHLFPEGDAGVWAFISGHARKYGKMPAVSTVVEKTGFDMAEVKEPPAFYLDQLRERYVEQELKRLTLEAGEHLKGDAKKPMNALDVMRAGIAALVIRNSAEFIFDLRDAQERVWAEYAAKWKAQGNYGIRTGWPYLDDFTGGMMPGDLISYVGRPQQGKTFQLLYSALTAWEGQLRPVVFFTNEMKPSLIEERLVAMISSFSLSRLKRLGMSKGDIAKLKDKMGEVSQLPVPFYTVDGSKTPYVDDMIALVQHLGPAAVYVDGAYLSKHRKERDRFRRVAENVDMLKFDMASGCNVPVTATWQFSKEGSKKAKKKDGENTVPTLEDIGYSDAIAQHSSIVLGLFEKDSVETLTQRRVDILKGRAGEVGHFFIKWDFQNMIFDQVMHANVADLQFA